MALRQPIVSKRSFSSAIPWLEPLTSYRPTARAWSLPTCLPSMSADRAAPAQLPRLVRCMRPGAEAHHNNETVETLAPQMVEGVWAEGTRITRTIPAGSIGNEKELKVVSETWYSKDLQTVVMSKHSDPRTGESTFRMTNIQRAEPDASLFQVPAGYKVTEGGRRRF